MDENENPWSLEKRVLVGADVVMEEIVTTDHDSPALGIATHHVTGREFQFFPSKDAAEAFLQKQQEADAIRKAPCPACGYQKFGGREVYYSLKKYEFDESDLPINFNQLLQEPQQRTLEPRTEHSSGSYRT